MTIYKLIFSETTALKRHFTFWLVYCFFFYIHSLTSKAIFLLNSSNSFYIAWVNLYCFLPVCIISVYFFLYVPLPPYRQKIKYIQLIAAGLVLFIAGSIINYFMAILYFKNTGNLDELKQVPLYIFSYGNNNVLLALAMGFFAAALKFTKERYTKRRQILKVGNQKAKEELQVLKASIQPGFLFHSLNCLEENIKCYSSESPNLVLRFSEVLSYLLYDCDEELKPLQQELSAIEKYLSLEKIKMKNRALIYFQQTGSPENNLIVPSLLLSFVQNCFLQLYDERFTEFIVKVKTTIYLDKINLIFSFTQTEETKRYRFNPKEIIASTQEVLNKFYKNKNRLDIKRNKNQTIISLMLLLDKISRPANLTPVIQLNEAIYETV